MPIHPAQLVVTALGAVRFEPDEEFPVEDIGNVSYTVEPGVELGDLQHQEDGRVTAGMKVHVSVVFTRLDESEGPTPFELELDVHGMFQWTAETFPADERLARGWLQYNGMYLLWPYVRSYITGLTAQSWFPALMIGTMNVPTPPEIPADEEEPVADEEKPVAGDGSPAATTREENV